MKSNSPTKYRDNSTLKAKWQRPEDHRSTMVSIKIMTTMAYHSASTHKLKQSMAPNLRWDEKNAYGHVIFHNDAKGVEI